MTAPYDGDRGANAPGPPEDPGQEPRREANHDPYLQDTYNHDPYRSQDPTLHDPVTRAAYDRSRPAPGASGRPTVQEHQQSPYPQAWPPNATQAPTYGSAPEGQGQYAAQQSAPPASGQPTMQDAFAHLYRDQEAYGAPQRAGYGHQEPPAASPFDAGYSGEPAPSSQQQGAPSPHEAYGAGPGTYGNDPGRHPSPGPGPAGHPVYPPQPLSAEPADEAVPPQPGEAPGPQTQPEPTAASSKRGSGLLKSSAIMAAGTMVSRLTGFVRSALIASALGAAVLGDAWQIAYTLPTMIFILTIGGGLNSVFVPQLVRAMKEDEDGGEAYANRLLTLVIVVLGAVTVIAVAAAPLLVKLMSYDFSQDPATNEVTVTFTRYCVITIFFMGVHVVMGQILNARGRFGAMMWTPVLNNVVMIATFGLFIWVYGTADRSHLGVTTIPDAGIRLLGIGTVLGLVVQSLAMVPYLRDAGFRIRLRFDWRGHGLGKAAKLAKWTVLFVLANQAGVLVVTQLATWAGSSADKHGSPGAGYMAYSNAQLIWNMPQAIITVSVMAALLPRLARSASDGDPGAVRDDMSQGLRTSAVAIVPIAFGFLSIGVPLCTLIYQSSGAGVSMGYMLMAFGVGLIPFSVQYVVLRAFYAYEDTRTPFYNTVIVASVNAAASALCFLLLPDRWAVVGMAASYGLAYIIGVGVAWRRLRKRMGIDLDGAHIVRTYARLAGASIPATLLSGVVVYVIMHALGSDVLGSLTALVAGGLVLAVVFVAAARRMRVEEMNALVGMVRRKLGR